MDLMDEQELRKRINITTNQEIEEIQPLIQDEDDKLLKEKKDLAAKVNKNKNKYIIEVK